MQAHPLPLSKKRAIDAQFIKIALPAFAQFAAEPLARLVDTAYLGRLGANALGGAGAAIAAQYAVAKLYNDPLLRSTISIIAAQEGEGADARADAAASALLLALLVGITQGLFYALFAGPILTASCVGPASSMRSAALGYLRVCAVGAPTTTLWLVANGIFRGLGDTMTPLLWALVFTGLNAVLDGIFIFPCGMGTAGAAMGTALSQTIALVPLLMTLQHKLQSARQEQAARRGVECRPGHLFRPAGGIVQAGKSLKQYFSAGGLMLLRTVGKISAYSVCAREAARLGAASSAAHNLCFQLGVATTQLCESLGIATQTLLARELSRKEPDDAEEGSDGRRRGALPARASVLRHILTRGVGVGALVAGSLATLTFVNRNRVVNGLTTIPEVRMAAIGVMPFVLTCQALKGLAYPLNGALMGGLDWGFSAAGMWAAQISCVGAVVALSRGGSRPLSLYGLWSTLVLLFAVQIFTAILRIVSGTGPWAALYERSADMDNEE
ncbi:MAG: hypothetical protein SGPRY_003896 [Prymnesium sp.]